MNFAINSHTTTILSMSGNRPFALPASELLFGWSFDDPFKKTEREPCKLLDWL